MWLLSCVGAHVCLEVIGSRELPLAHVALEGTNSRVLPAVSAKLVRARESLPTTLVIADVGLLPRVLPNVHLQVGQLQVALGASRIETDERFPLLLCLRHHCLCADQLGRLRHLRSYLGNDERWVAGHGHVDGVGSLVLVCVSWGTIHPGHDLNRQGSWSGEVGGVSVNRLSGAVFVDGGERCWIVLEGDCGCGGESAGGDRRGVNGGRELREMLLLRLRDQGLLRWLRARHRLHHNLGGGVGDGGVVGREIVLRHWRARVHGGGVGRWRELLVFESEGGVR